ncbi:MAG: exo-alpha-sialidase [Fuerstiella sp.]|nr:exo-alpha-sialidase [Fuerstiella sp.]MCP4855507.1 exo-alpha-sialidase [Fuerstiella sp.]
MPQISRRTMLSASAAGILASQSQITLAAAAPPKLSVGEVKTISLQSDRYHGWPTMIQRKNGELLVVCSGGRESHVCPFGRVELIRSTDDGETWTYARTILDGPIDDRDAGILETAQGTLLATTFTSLAYEPGLKKAADAAGQGSATMQPDQLARWQAAHRRLSDSERPKQLGCWMLRSENGGQSWSPAYRVPVNSPHGPINLSDGRLFYAGVTLWKNERTVDVCVSEDDGKTWNRVSEIPTRPGDDSSNYHELHAVEAVDGRLVIQIRNHNKANSGETLQTHSTDGGKTWAEPYAIDVWGLPSHLLRLADDRLLMTYGHRRAPLGNQARISTDNGQTWSESIIIYGEATSGDLGYPSTVEIAANQFVTVWYEKLSDNSFAQLRMARWQLG